MTDAVADGTDGHGAFQHAGANALARHFQQAEMGDVADLDSCPVVLQAFLQLALDRPVVAFFLHVDEVDDNEACKIAQAQLPGNFFCGFQIGLQSGCLDGMFTRRLAGVDVDRHQRFGLVDDQIAAGLQRYLRGYHLLQLAFDAVARKDRLIALVEFHILLMARHEHVHETAGFLITGFAGNDDLADILVVQVADRALDQAAFLVDQDRCGGGEGQIADVVPQPHQIIEIALDLFLLAGGPGGAQDDAHALGHVE